jgi:cell division protein ZapA
VKVRITIRGQQYTIRSDEDDVDLQEVARYVDRKMEEVGGPTKTIDDYTVAMLTALNIASELRRLQQRVDQELARLDRELSGIAVMMEAALPPEEEPGEG